MEIFFSSFKCENKAQIGRYRKSSLTPCAYSVDMLNALVGIGSDERELLKKCFVRNFSRQLLNMVTKFSKNIAYSGLFIHL